MNVDLYMPSSIRSIQDESFRGTNIKSVLIPSSVQFISDSAFESGVKIYGNKGSYSENWAMQKGYPFVAID